jgi:flagellar motor switch/type III secretory pathway protein FliN
MSTEVSNKAGQAAQADGVPIESYGPVNDVDLAIWAELDRRTITLRELLRLEVDGLLLLSRPAGENIDVYAGGVLLGSAEILAGDERLAVRIADLRDQSGTPQA